MSVFLVIEVEHSDAERFREYERQAQPIAFRFGAELVARDENPLLVERDDKPTLSVILRFPDKAAVEGYFAAADYAPLRRFRQSFATARAIAIEA
ncbi:DUF1330 domain-containing protein [Catenuloplanes atrovinosus]|uniref:Uncharacterized protein (DUF1330 family) n=1 Tax=Catenuloplanes atrovinosus TaxID=137266 RepID=A0AAE4CBL5_9ACTN|nr:DUF1330 domain-containing protein [Catenuloplanes atrovinosus]MDR7277049.1 uncharacterized protein (DUF1330 family) [Catenuloplanes atrovinosus]